MSFHKQRLFTFSIAIARAGYEFVTHVWELRFLARPRLSRETKTENCTGMNAWLAARPIRNQHGWASFEQTRS